MVLVLETKRLTDAVQSTNGGKHLGHHNKRWDNVFRMSRWIWNNTNGVGITLDDYEEGSW